MSVQICYCFLAAAQKFEIHVESADNVFKMCLVAVPVTIVEGFPDIFRGFKENIFLYRIG